MHDHGQTCPSCCSSKYSNPQLKLMVNTCGHSLCENCVEVLFVRGSGLCVQCKTPLRKANFRYQLFEDPLVQTEVELRKKILSDFNKREEDFDSLEDYDLYLEKIEEIIYNLMNDVDIENTKRYIEAYKRENKDIIKKNRLRASTSLAYYNAELERETILREKRQLEDEMHKQQKRTEAIQLLGQLNNAPKRPNNDFHGQNQAADTARTPVTLSAGTRQLIPPSAMGRPTPTALPPLPPPSAFGSVNTPASVLPLRQTPSTGFVVPPSAMPLNGGWNPVGGAVAFRNHLNTWSPGRGLSTPRQPDTVLIPTRSQSGRLSKSSATVAATFSAGATGSLTSGRHKLDPSSTNATSTVYTHQPYQFDSGGPPVPNGNTVDDQRWSELLRVYRHAVIRQLPGNKTDPAVATARWGDVNLEPECEADLKCEDHEGGGDTVESDPQHLGASCQLPVGACGISPGVFLQRCLQEARCALFM